MPIMEIVRNIKALREAIRGLRSIGKRIALVPTMGALHSGHISLVNEAFAHADAVIVSIFVNPTQFGPNEDFSKYPRTEAADLQALEQAGVTIAYVPTVEEMYPANAVARVQVAGISAELCGAFRPGHFDGVATIVSKLFMQALPDVAVFGEKDFQQLAIIRRFTADLDIPVQVLGAPIIREADGLALSSRNRYLSPQERAIAPAMYATLTALAAEIRNLQGGALAQALQHAGDALRAAWFTKLDYVELRDKETLLRVDKISAPARLLAAAHIGTTRLIDNIEVLP